MLALCDLCTDKDMGHFVATRFYYICRETLWPIIPYSFLLPKHNRAVSFTRRVLTINYGWHSDSRVTDPENHLN